MVHSRTPLRTASTSHPADFSDPMLSPVPMPGSDDVIVGVGSDDIISVGDKLPRSSAHHHHPHHLAQAHPHPQTSSASTSSSSSAAAAASPSAAAGSTSSCGLLPAGEAAVYGQLVILGYNGSLPSGERRRRKSKFTLVRRPVPNGLRKARSTLVNLKTPNVVELPAVADRGVHSISYTLNRNQAVVVEYVHDDKTDLFQVGRSSEKPIDFVVMDTGGTGASGLSNGGGGGQGGGNPSSSQGGSGQSTISRFACRLLVTRRDPDSDPEKPVVVRLYAAGFNSESNIFLGEKATKWQEGREGGGGSGGGGGGSCGGDMDGLTTNGVLLMHPDGEFVGGGAEPGRWREVSVDGNVFSLREARSSSRRGEELRDETNVLVDGSLVDLCGATLLWRSADGLRNSPTRRHVDWMIEKINSGKPQCPVGLNTLVLPRHHGNPAPSSSAAAAGPAHQHMYVYLQCGHVQGQHNWGVVAEDERQCPMCFVVGRVARLEMGLEPALYVDFEPPTHAFNPCGHMASEKTVKYWACVPFPCGPSGYRAMCPFCAVSLEGYPGYTKLIFQDNIDQ